MADRATQIVNFFETTLASLLPAGQTSANLTDSPGINAALGDENTWYYLVINPDSSGSREVIAVKTSTGTSLSAIERDLETDHGGNGPDHQSGTTVRLAVLAQHIDDQNDRVATHITSLTDALSDFNTDSAAAIATHNTNSSSAISTFNTNGQDAIDDINAAAATTFMSDATDGSSIEVDIENDLMLVYDATDSTAKKVKAKQTNNEFKGYKETVQTLTSAAAIEIDLNDGNVGKVTLGHNVTDLDFLNVPASGAVTFTLECTQDGTGGRTMAIDGITLSNTGTADTTEVTGLTAAAGGLELTATADAKDIVTFLFINGGTPYVNSLLEMS